MMHSSPSLRAADTIDRCLSQILKYVEDVEVGKVPSNPRVGQLLMESVSRVATKDRQYSIRGYGQLNHAGTSMSE